MQFEFATANRILFGEGRLSEAGKLAAGLGGNALLALGAPHELSEPLLEGLETAGVRAVVFRVQGEPTLDTARQGAALARGEGCELVIGFGGGSALDAAKAIATLATNPGDPLDYLEVIGSGQPLAQMPLPVLAIPTTAGTGSEVTRNAVLGSPEHGVKASLRHPAMLPRVALIDPELTYALPPEITATTGMDALVQVIEPLVCAAPNPLVDALCREAIGRGARALPRVVEDGSDNVARREMCYVSLCGGLALANAKLGAVHGFAAAIGARYPAPHGAVCAALLAPVMAANLRALRQRDPQNPVLERYAEVARLLTGDLESCPEDGAAWAEGLASRLKIPPLSAYGLKSEHYAEVAAAAAKASSMKGNPVVLREEELVAVLQLGDKCGLWR